MTLHNLPLQRCSYCNEVNTRSGLNFYTVAVKDETHIVRLCQTKCIKFFGKNIDAALDAYVKDQVAELEKKIKESALPN